MGIKLTLKQDQLVPINALKEWSKKTLEPIQNEGSEVSSIFVKMFDTATGKPEKYREYAGMVNNVIKELPAPTQEKGNRAWFLRVFLQPFGGKATKEAEELFKVLAKGFGNKASFADIEKAADDYNNKLKGLTTEVATNARDLNNFLMNDFAVAVRDFSTAYKQAKEAPVATAASTGTPAGGPPAPQPDAAASTATAAAATTAATAESISRELYQSKKLLELGFITENEYLAKLVEIKTRLQEQESQPQVRPPVHRTGRFGWHRPPNNQRAETKAGSAQGTQVVAAVPAPPQPAAQTPAVPSAGQQQPQSNQADNVDKGIETLIGTADKQGEISKLASRASGLQDTMTRFSQGLVSEALSYREKKLAMLYTKKQVLAEYVKTGIKPEKTQLNEFLLTGLILAALAGALAWAASKLGSLFKDSYPRYSSGPSHSSGTGDPQKDLSELANSLGSGIDASGKLVDANGRQVPAIETEINKHVKGLTDIQNAIAAGVTEVSKKENHPNQTINPKIQTQLTAVTKKQSKIEPAVNKLLASLKNFVTEATKV